MANLNLDDRCSDDSYRGISFDEHGVLVINGWTISIDHETMKLYLNRYLSADKWTQMNPYEGFFVNISDKESFNKNGVLTHKGAKMAFYEGEIEKIIEWLANQYGSDL